MAAIENPLEVLSRAASMVETTDAQSEFSFNIHALSSNSIEDQVVVIISLRLHFDLTT